MKTKLTQCLALGLCMSIMCQTLGCTQANDNADGTESGSTKPGLSAADLPATAIYTVDCDTAQLDESSRISDTLYGLFLEDINFAVDGGLYAELIRNRSFEYGSAAANEGMHGWTNSNPEILDFEVVDGSEDNSCLNENNTHYAILTNRDLALATPYEGIENAGYLDGLAVTGGETYLVSLYLKGNTDYENPKGRDNYDGEVRLALEGEDGTVFAETFLDGITDNWTKYEASLVPTEDVTDGLRFCVQIGAGSVCVDMVSLMPEDTYKGLPIRKDIGEYLEALSPSFLRFPGGCVIEGKDEESIYSWKDSIGNGLSFTINGETTVGDIAARPQGRDIWSGTKQDPYYTTYGIGFYEYFLLCEALDCMPVPVLNAGMTCQVQSPKYIVYPLNSDEFAAYIQDALDLVEFCLGGEDTTWGAVRIAMGHKEPFALKYVAIGNEQWQSEYHAHYEKFVEAFTKAAAENPDLYGEIELIVANGTASGSTEGWSYLEDCPDSVTTLVDEHYYESPGWFLENTKRYDAYDRGTQARVFLGEYAAQSNTLEAALAEAAYMTGLERNGDIVAMACYAPLFGNSKTNQWTPDMMFFSNHSVYGTPNYYVQQMFANHVGSMTLSSSLTVDAGATETALTGRVGLGSWMTSVAYDNLTVTANADGKVLYSCDFENESALKDDGWLEHEGDWHIGDGRLIQENTSDPWDTNTGDAIYVGDVDWNNYTLTVEGEILGGSEGFLIPVCVENTDNNIFWNIGGWGNTVSCLQIVAGGAKSGQVSGTVRNLTLKRGQTYTLKVVVDGNSIKCYIDDSLYVDYTKQSTESVYETAGIAENGDIILKIVNTTSQTVDIQTVLEHFDAAAYDASATVTLLSGERLNEVNSFDDPTKLFPVESTVDIAEQFTYPSPKYSVSILRIKAK